MRIRPALPKDAEELLQIYTPYVETNAVSFETEVPTPLQFQERIATTLSKYPWLICEKENHIAGYAYASTHRLRSAYEWSVDVAIYIAENFRRQGVARELYRTLFETLREQGFVNAFAGITLPNPGSIALHESLGFEPIGIYRNVGYKNGQWHDVGWWQFNLQQINKPQEITPYLQLIQPT